jgi:AcrR family transcriptional regulator
MVEKSRDAEQAKAAILKAARRLFAERDYAAVSIRDIAAAAGVSHGLLQHHFGTRQQLVAAVIVSEIAEFAATPRTLPDGAADDFERLRAELSAGMTRFRDYALLILRAELAGAEPEKLLDPHAQTPAKMLASSIRRLQAGTAHRPGALDPDLVAAYVMAGFFSFQAMAPWLMASVGLEPRDYEARLDEIVDISVRLVALASGVSPEAGEPSSASAPEGAGGGTRD